jgi:STE24 endopeptidase
MAGLDWERQEKARSYARIMRPLAFLEIGIATFFILVLLLTPLSTSLRNLLDFPQPLRVALYLTTIMLCFAIVSAPLSFYRGFLLPHRFGLLSQILRGLAP